MELQLKRSIRGRWCSEVAIDHCDGSHGRVSIGALEDTKDHPLRNANLTLMTGRWQPSNIRCWRLLVPPILTEVRRIGLQASSSAQVVYQFGVFRGGSMYQYRHLWPDALLLGFDSFEGLPTEQPGEVRRATWNRGTFGITEPDIARRIYTDLGRERTRLFRGFFNQSLTPSLALGLQPATLVDIDSDIYVSAYQALDWLFHHRLAVPGTVVAYDDWADYACALPAIERSILSASAALCSRHELDLAMSRRASARQGVAAAPARQRGALGLPDWPHGAEPQEPLEGRRHQRRRPSAREGQRLSRPLRRRRAQGARRDRKKARRHLSLPRRLVRARGCEPKGQGRSDQQGGRLEGRVRSAQCVRRHLCGNGRTRQGPRWRGPRQRGRREGGARRGDGWWRGP